MDPSLVSENVGWSGTAGFLPVRGDSGAHGTARHRVALEVRCGASHCLERTRRRTRSDAVDAGVFVGAWGVGHVLRRTHCKAILVSGASAGKSRARTIENLPCATKKERSRSAQRGTSRCCSKFSAPDSQPAI